MTCHPTVLKTDFPDIPTVTGKGNLTDFKTAVCTSKPGGGGSLFWLSTVDTLLSAVEDQEVTFPHTDPDPVPVSPKCPHSPD